MSEKDQEIASLKAQIARLEAERNALTAKKDELEEALASLQAQNAWLRRKVFGSSMSEKHLPLDPNVLEPTLFDTPLPDSVIPKGMAADSLLADIIQDFER